MKKALVKIKGIVQGVGFRPFIHRYIGAAGLNGTIKNTSSGVELRLEGEESELRRVVSGIAENAPPLARIESIETELSEGPAEFNNFSILPSSADSTRTALISPDIAVCPDCLRELRRAGDRRSGFPFINCTNCGPRFTIIRDVPYDRANTSMGRFEMCPECAREYGDITNRRYHAQPDCCPVCGPKLTYYNENGVPLDSDPIEAARRLLKSGGILAVMGLGGVHLACLAENPAVCAELRRRKQRDEKPFAVMCRDTAAARELCLVNAAEERSLESYQRPIVLLEKRSPQSLPHLSDNRRLGVMLPYTPLHYLLLGGDLKTLVMTSANLSDTPIVFKQGEALERLAGIADGFLLHDREILTRCDDSLLWNLDGREYFARRSRGYVPYPVAVPVSSMLLACGAEQKASFCLSKAGHAFPGQHIGDLKNYETLENYEQQIEHFKKLFDIKPSAVVCDLHPDYMSSDYAARVSERDGIPLIRVQHHHAHMAACMADNGLEGPVIGLIWDGTGLGTDGTSWGAECLTGDYAGFERFGSIREIPLPGGDRAAKEIFRTAFALLQASGCAAEQLPNARMLGMMLERGLNCPLSSGMGRLFDGVSAIIGIRQTCSYEGQGAVLLEASAIEDGGSYTLEFEGGAPVRFDWRPMIREITAELACGTEPGRIAARFMNTMINMAVRMCTMAAAQSGLKRVVLSGGSFQNMYIMNRLPAALRGAGLEPYWHHRVSTNDEGLSLGQLMTAQTRGF